ncbi:MAG: SUMF1/EgtB/PvdO family nonheme iron enzyme [Cyclobacteriaceae bacterium]|nr:SUMF1/EgtB/PvdO family nonheme iron enzyme [Cyclobacteriaceae bacterium]
MRFLFLLFFVCGLELSGNTQSAISNVSVEIEGEVVKIHYDFLAKEKNGYQVKVSLVNDSLSRSVQLQQLKGDVGNVTPGTGKIISWNLPRTPIGFPMKKVRFQIDIFRIPDQVQKMVFVEEGSFMMGSENAGEDAVPLHPVSISSFYIGITEVTVAEYLEFCHETNYPIPASQELKDDHPITFVSWYDANAFIEWIVKKSGLQYRLPTEAEWEFAASGGNYTKGLAYSGGENINDVGWYNQNSLGSMHHPVSRLKPNELGAYDMTGNVWEWCQDWYNSKFYSVSPTRDPVGPAVGKVKVGRGGSWYNKGVPIGFRYFMTPQSKTNYVGFRLALSANDNPLILESKGFSETLNIERSKNESVAQTKNSIQPIIQIINPVVERGQVFSHFGAEIKIKGKVTAASKLLLLLVNGIETTVDEEGYFERAVALKYLDNEIQIRAIDIDRNVGSETFTVNREINETDAVRNSSVARGINYALLIGTNEYNEFTDLSNPIFDIKTIATELEQSYGFEVNTVVDPTLEQFYSVLRSYGGRKYSSLDQLFIFVAGHGVFDEVFGDGYLVLSDSRKDDQNKTSYISHSNLRTILNNIDCPHIFLVLDVCFGGTFDPIVARRGDEYEALNRDMFIRRKLQYRTRQYLTSGGKTYVSDGRKGSHSPFAREFIRALRGYGGADRVLTINEIVGFVEKVQPEPRRGEFGNNEPGSDFLFITKEN